MISCALKNSYYIKYLNVTSLFIFEEKDMEKHDSLNKSLYIYFLFQTYSLSQCRATQSNNMVICEGIHFHILIIISYNINI